jgi:hypothetical protein
MTPEELMKDPDEDEAQQPAAAAGEQASAAPGEPA